MLNRPLANVLQKREIGTEMPLRIAINGYGRIGRCVLRALYETGVRDQFQVVAVNELADCKTIGHLTKYDSTHGRFPGEVDIEDDQLTINSDQILVLHRERIEDLPWADLDIDIVLECTGTFSDRATAQKHIDSGAKRVLFSQPAQADIDATIVYGFNESSLTGRETIISNASCTTNCSVPVINALHDAFIIESGVITTIHSAMNDQPVIDAYHHTDLRKTRSVFQSIIPIDTGLSQGIDRLLPELTGRFEAQAMRVPTMNVSAIDMSVVVSDEVNVERVNGILKKAAKTRFRGVLGYTDELLASCDFNHDLRSGIIDSGNDGWRGGSTRFLYRKWLFYSHKYTHLQWRHQTYGVAS